MEQFRSLGRERARLADVVEEVGRLTTRHAESVELLAISIGEEDEDMLVAVAEEVAEITARIEDLNTRRLFDDEHDPGDCFLTVPSRFRRHRSARLGVNVVSHVFCAMPSATIIKPKTLEEAGGEVAGLKKCRHQNCRFFMPTGICVWKAASIVWCENPRLILIIVVILLLPVYLFFRLWMKPLRWKSISPNCVLTPIVPAVPAASM